MDQKKAKEIADNAELSIQDYLDSIETAAKKGLYIAECDISCLTYPFVHAIQTRLRNLGFMSNKQGSVLRISWIRDLDDQMNDKVSIP